jgi:hypothetical protein
MTSSPDRSPVTGGSATAAAPGEPPQHSRRHGGPFKAARLFPLAALVEATGLTANDIATAARMNGTRMAEIIVEGFTTLEADRAAVRCGQHPATVWDDWYELAVLVDSCGTHYGHNRHRRAGETPCDDCLAAEAAYKRARRKVAA